MYRIISFVNKSERAVLRHYLRRTKREKLAKQHKSNLHDDGNGLLKSLTNRTRLFMEETSKTIAMSVHVDCEVTGAPLEM